MLDSGGIAGMLLYGIFYSTGMYTLVEAPEVERDAALRAQLPQSVRSLVSR